MAIRVDLGVISNRFICKTQGSGLKNGVFGGSVLPQKFCFRGEKLKGKGGGAGVVRSVMQVGVEEVKGFEGSLGIDLASEKELREKGFLGLRKTKLICTIGPACCSMEDLKKLALGGMNVARLNMCHNTREWHCDVIRKIKKLNEENGFCVSVMIDTEGSQHVVDHGAPSSVKAEDGSIWEFTSERFEGSRPFTVQAKYAGFSEGIKVGDEIVIDGGMASFEVIERIGNYIRYKCTDPGLLLPRAKMSFWRNGKLVEDNDELPTIFTKDWSDIAFGISVRGGFHCHVICKRC